MRANELVAPGFIAMHAVGVAGGTEDICFNTCFTRLELAYARVFTWDFCPSGGIKTVATDGTF